MSEFKDAFKRGFIEGLFIGLLIYVAIRIGAALSVEEVETKRPDVSVGFVRYLALYALGQGIILTLLPAGVLAILAYYIRSLELMRFSGSLLGLAAILLFLMPRVFTPRIDRSPRAFKASSA